MTEVSAVSQPNMLLSELGVIRAAHIVLACNTPHRASVLSEQVSINARCVVPAAAAVPAVPGPASMRFIHLASLARLCDASGEMFGVALLAGILGPIATRAVRADPLAAAQTAAFILSTNIGSYLGLGSAAIGPDADGQRYRSRRR